MKSELKVNDQDLLAQEERDVAKAMEQFKTDGGGQGDDHKETESSEVFPIIFLDFDGVLNSQLAAVAGRLKDSLDPEAVSRLNEIVSHTDAKVVVSSVWRLGRTVEDLQRILDKAGFEGEVIGRTKDLCKGPYGSEMLRGNEILEWIKDHPDLTAPDYSKYKRYVILDDDSDMLYWQRFNFIHVDGWFGLSPRNVHHAIRMLT